jgi:hypothetical protein
MMCVCLASIRHPTLIKSRHYCMYTYHATALLGSPNRAAGIQGSYPNYDACAHFDNRTPQYNIGAQHLQCLELQSQHKEADLVATVIPLTSLKYSLW